MGSCPHGHMFCSSLQLKTWYVLLAGRVEEEGKHKEILESKEPAPRKTTVFWRGGEKVALRARLGDLQQRTRVDRLQDVSVTEYAIPFWCRGLPATEMLECLGSMGVPDVKCSTLLNIYSYKCSTSSSRLNGLWKWAVIEWS